MKRAGVVYTGEERLTDSNPSPRITEEKESGEKVLFSLSNLRIKSGKEEWGRCGWASRRAQTGIASCVCPLGSVTHTSPWLN